MTAKTRSPRLLYIDALRGLAILGVLAYHLAIANSIGGALGRLLFSGARGVQLFFVVSAFTLCLSLDSKLATEQRPIAAYFVRRFFRIVPLHHLALVAVLWYRGLGPRLAAPEGLAWWDVAMAALFLNGWHPYRFAAFVPGAWTIVTEVCFYTVLPVVHRLVRSLRGAAVLLAFTVPLAFLARWGILAAFPHQDQEYVAAFSWMNFAAQAPVFAVGILCYHLVRQGLLAQWHARGLAPAMFLTAALAVLLLPFLPIGEFEACLIYGLVCGVLLLGLHCMPLPVVVNRLLIFWGVRSYSAYIAHPGVMHLLQPLRRWLADGLPTWLAASLWSLVVLAAVAATAHLLHLAIEEPGRRLGARLIQKWGFGARSGQAVTSA
jgi:peptidoglycan/LPS O-acetylase OafA/YrhL